jgi:hypothetical protein
MKARAEQFWSDWHDANWHKSGVLKLMPQLLAAFAAKEVARSEKVAMAVAVLLRAKCSDKEWEALPKELTSVADDALARAVEEERESCAKAVDRGKELWIEGDCLENGCACWVEYVKHAIHERSQVKGEGL